MAILAIDGGKPVRNKPFPSWPVHGAREKQLLNEILDSGKWWYGDKVREFEEKYAAYHDAKFGITTSNGTTSLQVALAAVGVGPGDEVIVPPYTFIATATAVLMVNAIPVFVDIDPLTFNIVPAKIEEAITDRTKAVIPVHFAGLPCDMDEILKIAEEHDLKVVEDACHAWGSEWKGRKVGAIGEMGCFSFQMSKNITSGEGGIILTNDEDLAEKAFALMNCGRAKNRPWYEHHVVGGNYRITEFQAAILLAQLERLDEQVTVRLNNGRYLDKALSEIDGITVLKEDRRTERRSYHLYCFIYSAENFCGLSREKFLAALNREGIPASGGYGMPLYQNPLFEKLGSDIRQCPFACPHYGAKLDYAKVHCPGVERVCKEAVWFTQNMLLGTTEDMDDIVTAIKKIKDNAPEIV